VPPLKPCLVLPEPFPFPPVFSSSSQHPLFNHVAGFFHSGRNSPFAFSRHSICFLIASNSSSIGGRVPFSFFQHFRAYFFSVLFGYAFQKDKKSAGGVFFSKRDSGFSKRDSGFSAA
jgi:hypothetical protein